MAFNFEGFEYKPVGKTPAQQNEANREHYGQQPGVYTTGSLNHDAFNESDHPRAANGQFGKGSSTERKQAQGKEAIAKMNEKTDRETQAKEEAHLKTEQGEKERQERNAATVKRMREAREASENTARVNPSVEARVTAAREARQEQRKKDLAEEAEGKKRDAERAERLKGAATNDTDIELLRQELNEFLTEEKQELEHKDFNLIAAQ